MKKVSVISFLVLLSILIVVSYVGADFYVIPTKGQVTSWDKKIPGATRFQLVLDGAAVLDKETGLVWEKSPDTAIPTRKPWTSTTETTADEYCYKREIAGRKGWRLPTVEELASLIDTSDSIPPALPAGHPFLNVTNAAFWSSTTYNQDTTKAWLVGTEFGFVDTNIKVGKNSVWCVRGGYGHDAY